MNTAHDDPNDGPTAGSGTPTPLKPSHTIIKTYSEGYPALAGHQIAQNSKNPNTSPSPSPTTRVNKKNPNYIIPPPPALLYFGNKKSLEINVDGKAVQIYWITGAMDLRHRKQEE